MIRAYFILIIAVMHGFLVQAQKYILSDEGSSVGFTIVNHLVTTTTVNGSFKGLKGGIVFDPNAAEKSTFEASVDVNTISTGIGMRDHDLKQEKYFNAEKFPLIKIVSTKIEKGDKADTYVLIGELTIKGVSKTIKIPFTAIPHGDGYQFSAEFKMNRLDYNVGGKGQIEDNLIVKLNVHAKKA